MTDIKALAALALVFVAFLLATRRPVFSVLAFLVLIYIRPFDDRPNLANLHLPNLFIGVIVFAYVARSIRINRWLPNSSLTVPLLAFCGWAVFSALVGVDVPLSMERLVPLLIATGTTFAILQLISSEQELRWIHWVLLVCAMVFVYSAIYLGSDCIQTQDGLGCGRRNFSKVNSNFGPPNYLGLSLVVAVNIAYGLFLYYRFRPLGLGCIASIAAFVWIILLTNSRGSFIALGVTALLHWLFSRHKLRGTLALIALVSAVLMLAPDSFFDRIGTLNSIEEDQSAMGRVELWGIAIGLIGQSPLTGVGIGNFEKFAPNTPHNAYVQIAVEMGIPALLFWIWMMLRALRGLFAVWRDARERPDKRFLAFAAIATAGALLAVLVQAGSTGLAHREFVYVVVAIAGLVPMLYDQADSKGATVGRPA